MVIYQDGWERVTLGQIASFHKGGSLSKSDLTTSGVPCILYGQLYTRYKEIVGSVTSYCSPERSDLTLSQAEDVLLPASGETPEEMAKASCLTSSGVAIGGDIIIARPRPGLSGRFLSYQLNSVLVNKIASVAQGSAVVHLSRERVSQLETIIPSETEQNVIADLLQEFDEHLANLDELIVKKKAIRDGTLESLVSGEQRLGAFKYPWREVPLDSIAYSRRESVGTEPMSMDVELENILPGEGRLVGDTSVRTASSFIFRTGDVLFGRLRPYLRKFWYATNTGVRSGEIWALVAKEEVDSKFLFHLIRTQRFLDSAGKTMGTKMPRADWNLMKSQRFCIPHSLEEQRAIAEVLSGMDEEIRLLEEERVKVERLKLGAMDDLLTGRVRLPIEEEAA